MKKKLRIEFTPQELEQLISALHQSSGREDPLSTKLSAKFLSIVPAAVPDKTTTEIKENLNNEADWLLKGAISVLTGRAKDSIKPGDKLIDLGLTPTKTAQLRVHINKFIRKKGGNAFITSSEMSGIETFEQLLAATLNKLP